MPPSEELPTTPAAPPALIHKAAIAGAILSPLVMLLPPRKLDFRNFFLLGTFAVSANQLSYDYTGTSIHARIGRRMESATGLPEGARRTQEMLRERREREGTLKKAQGQEEEGKGLKGLVKSAWMGGEDEDWQAKRAAEHQKSFDEGKGISTIILEQIADVWKGISRDTPKNDAGPENDERSEKR